MDLSVFYLPLVPRVVVAVAGLVLVVVMRRRLRGAAWWAVGGFGALVLGTVADLGWALYGMGVYEAGLDPRVLRQWDATVLTVVPLVCAVGLVLLVVAVVAGRRRVEVVA